MITRNRRPEEVSRYQGAKGLILAILILVWIFLWFSANRSSEPQLRPISLTSPKSGSKVMVKGATWKGVAEPYSQVKLMFGKEVLGATVADPSGNFMIQPNLNPPYPTTLRLTQELPDGKKGTSDPLEYRWQESPDVNFVLTSGFPATHPASEDLVLTGTAEGPGVVYMMSEGAAISSANVPAAGPWRLVTRFQVPYPKVVSLLFQASGTDSRLEAGPFPLILDGKKDSDGVFRITRPVSSGVVTIGDWVIAGTGKPGELVKVKMDKYPLGEAKVSADGTWSLPRTIYQASKGRVIIGTQGGGATQRVVVDVVSR